MVRQTFLRWREAGLVFAAVLVAVFAAYAEEQQQPAQVKAWKSWYVMPGGGYLTSTKINDGLAAQGLATIPRYYLSFSLGNHTAFKRLILGSELSAQWFRDRTLGDRTSHLFGANAMLDVGVDLVNSERLSLFPYFGAGAGLAELQVSTHKLALADYLKDTSPPARIFQPTLLLDVGLQAQVQFTAPRTGKQKLIGLRAGYLIDPTAKTEWHADGTEISNGPESALSGVYVKLVLGGRSPWKHDKGHSCGQKCTMSHGGPAGQPKPEP